MTEGILQVSQSEVPRFGAGPGCRQDAIVMASARLVNTLYDFIHNVTHGGTNADKASFKFLDSANLDQLLLLGHSLGGNVACAILSGML